MIKKHRALTVIPPQDGWLRAWAAVISALIVLTGIAGLQTSRPPASFNAQMTAGRLIKPVTTTSRLDVHQVPTPPAALAQSVPPTIDTLAFCTRGTVDIIVAHQDDDILFMNPDFSRMIADNRCIRSIFLTAGDDGRPAEYWQSREHAIMAAYADMLKTDNSWSEEFLTVQGHRLQLRRLNNYPNVGLVFFRLPDGNLAGEGFASTEYQSLERLQKRQIDSMTSVTGDAGYSYQTLIRMLADIIRTDHPMAIFSQLADGALSEGDHSDHRAVGHLAERARQAARVDTVLYAYIGYPVGFLEPNLDERTAADKQGTFSAYEQLDPLICSQGEGCRNHLTYTHYLDRSYRMERPLR